MTERNRKDCRPVDRRSWSCTGSELAWSTAPGRQAKCPCDQLLQPLKCRADRHSPRAAVQTFVRRTRASALNPGARPQSP
jgi:hypothetical protein